MIAEYERLLKRMTDAGRDEEWIYSAILLIEDLKKYHVSGIDILRKRLEENAANYEQYLDYFSEGEGELFFAFNGFHVEILPDGADMRADWQGHQIYVEYSRFRPDYETEERLRQALNQNNEALARYGNWARDVPKLNSKILEEAWQLPEDEIGLVFIRSDNVNMEELEFHGFEQLLTEQLRDNPTYSQLSGVLFDAVWTNVSTGKRFYLFLNPHATKQINEALTTKLASLQPVPRHSRGELPELRKRFPLS